MIIVIFHNKHAALKLVCKGMIAEFKLTFSYFLKNTYELQFGRELILSSSSPDFEQSILFPTLSASYTKLFWEAGFSKNAMKQE